MTAALLQADALSVDFPVHGGLLRREVARLRAVRDVSLALRAGEVLGILGESGCGKTTLGRALVGLIEPSAGTLRVEGHDVATLSPDERRRLTRDVQMVFQDPFASLNPRKRIRQSLALPFDTHGLATGDAREARIRELMALVGLAPEHLERWPHELSGGQRQRVAIARALATQPKVLVLDEPLSALDMSIQSQVLNLLVELQQRLGLSYVFISHDLAVVEYLSDRVAVMYLGRVVESAPAARLFASPRHPYTQALLASAPDPDPRAARVERPLEGEVPGALHAPAGCSFHTRCPLAQPRCRESVPELRIVDTGVPHAAACHLL
ncbi:ABC transporter ATP-binding protein [Scleromatobacter humisilvae]|uniref:ATP-binding cassette domain-containing protein n=1 Tax=Scleromatobacter humisilvae TaxID=2897159 RepID=A0A9X1YM84_9BURK|nr:oligopeptide/dipeptide ABC transporter ATP-binding protein [Scleromatobacter humisilvae]MCK9686962.1 ATP-binding cassette domain-containing protein [Scleromatobacter humisilvae]